MTATSAIHAFRGQYPGRFSAELGIDLSQGRSREIFKWFLASVLFGASISDTIVIKDLPRVRFQGTRSYYDHVKTLNWKAIG